MRQLFAAMMTSTTAAAGRVDVLPSGDITWQGGPTSVENNYTSLNNIIFWTE